MKRLRLSEKADRDLQEQYRYIARDSFDAADRVLDTLYTAIDQLARYPKLGKPGIRPGTRELVVKQFVVTYRVEDDVIHVLNVIQGARRD